MKKIIIFLVMFSSLVSSFAQETVTNRSGKEITVNSPASITAQGVVKLAGDLGGTADVPTVPTLINKLEGSGTINYISKFTAAKTLGNSLLFDNGTNVGIGTASPANTLEIKQGTEGNSGLRFTNLNSASTATTSASKVLTLNSSGDVILANVPGTQNIVDFSTATPTTSGVVFTPNTPADESVVYQSAVDNSMWTYNGTTYVTYSAPASTAWNLANTTNDAGSNKTSGIFRTGNVGIGTNNPTAPLDVQSTLVNPYLVSAKFLAPNNTTAGNATQLNFGVAATTGNSADWRYVYQGNGAASNRVDFGMSSYAAPMLSYLNSGNVGIGTTAPSSKLHIQGIQTTLGANANATMLRMSRSTYSGYKWGSVAQFNLGTYDDGVSAGNSKSRLDLVLANADETLSTTPTMTWLGNGNVGINNTAPSAPLVVQGVTGAGALKLIAPSVASGDNWWMGFGHGTTSTDANDRARIGVDIVTGGSGRLFFTTGPTGTQTRAMFIDENQKVGIGTSSPTGQFEVATSNGLSSIIRRFGNTSQAASNLILQKTYGTTATTHGAGIINGDYVGRILFSASNGTDYGTYNGTDIVGYAAGAQSATNNGGGIFFRTVPQNSVAASVERMRIEHNGNIGIGTSTPTAKLDVVSSVTDVARITTSLTTTNYAGLGIGNASGTWGKIAGGDSKLQIRNFSTDATVFHADLATGSIGIGTTAPGSKLEVNGAATNTTAFNAAAGTSIDFSKSNLAYTTASPGAFTLTNLKDGGTYTLAVQGTTAGTAGFTATGFTFKSVNNAATVSGKQTLYTFIVMGTTVYFYMATGF
jgi:hypothetical protein